MIEQPNPPDGYEIITEGTIQLDDLVWNKDGYWEKFGNLNEDYRSAMNTNSVSDFNFVARKLE